MFRFKFTGPLPWWGWLIFAVYAACVLAFEFRKHRRRRNGDKGASGK